MANRTSLEEAEHAAYCSSQNTLLILCLCTCPECYSNPMVECVCPHCADNNHHGHTEYHRKT